MFVWGVIVGAMIVGAVNIWGAFAAPAEYPSNVGDTVLSRLFMIIFGLVLAVQPIRELLIRERSFEDEPPIVCSIVIMFLAIVLAVYGTKYTGHQSWAFDWAWTDYPWLFYVQIYAAVAGLGSLSLLILRDRLNSK